MTAAAAAAKAWRRRRRQVIKSRQRHCWCWCMRRKTNAGRQLLRFVIAKGVAVTPHRNNALIRPTQQQTGIYYLFKTHISTETWYLSSRRRQRRRRRLCRSIIELLLMVLPYVAASDAVELNTVRNIEDINRTMRLVSSLMMVFATNTSRWLTKTLCIE